MDNHATEPRAHTAHKILNAHLTDLTMVISMPEVIIHQFYLYEFSRYLH
jgi:hypothetical protein